MEDVPSLAEVRDSAQLTSLLLSGACMHELESLCLSLNLRLKDLFPRPLEIFSTGNSEEIAQVRYQHYEKKRQYRLGKILQALRSRAQASCSPPSHSQDYTHLKKTSTESTLLNGTKRRENDSVSPVMYTETDELEEPADIVSTEVSVVDRKQGVQERLAMAQQRSLHLQLTDIADKVKKLKQKEQKLQLTKQEIRLAQLEKHRKRELHSAKIRENLQRKYQELAVFERQEARKGLETIAKTYNQARPRCKSIVPSRTMERKEEEDVQRQLQAIQTKLEDSAARASQRRYTAALSFASRYSHHQKAHERVRTESANEVQEALELALKLQKQQQKSQQLREQHLQFTLLRVSQRTHRGSSRSQMDTQRNSDPLCAYDTLETHKRRESNVTRIKQEMAHLRRLDVAENLARTKNLERERKHSIIEKHQNIVALWDKRLQERSVKDSSKLREDFQRQETRERLKSSVAERIAELQKELSN